MLSKRGGDGGDPPPGNRASSSAAAERGRRLGLSVLALTVFFLQVRHPLVRFAWPALDSLVGWSLALVLPWLVNAMLFRLGPKWARVLARVAAVPLLVYSMVPVTVLLVLGAWLAQEGRHLTTGRAGEIDWNGSRVRLYRTNDAGVFTRFGMDVRQELRLVPGLILVRDLDSFYPCSALRISRFEHGVAVQGDAASCAGAGGIRHEYRLKPQLYF